MEPHVNEEIAAFLAAESALRSEDGEPWVVFADQSCRGRFASFDAAYAYASAAFSAGQFLIHSLEDGAPKAPLMFIAD